MSFRNKLLVVNGSMQLTEGPIARQLIGRDASAAVGSSGLMVICIVGFFSGLSVGVGVVAGQAARGRDDRALTRIIRTAAGFTAPMSPVRSPGSVRHCACLSQNRPLGAGKGVRLHGAIHA